MPQTKRKEEFEKLVKNKFDVFNSLFLNLPYSRESKIGLLIPMLQEVGKTGLEVGEHPLAILDSFFDKYASITGEGDKIDFMFRVIQYVERQVVLYDSVEDAAFLPLKVLGKDLAIKDFFQFLERTGNREALLEKFSAFSARIVFTAHPTQFYPPAVLDIISQLQTLILKNDLNEIDVTLQQLGLTSLRNTRKPTPLDEARNIIYYLRNVYYDAVGELIALIRSETGYRQFANPNIIKLGFWPGGDRDGNPFVTARITHDVADELRMTLMKCYYDDVKKLQKKLTFRGINENLQELKNTLYKGMFDPLQRIAYEEIIDPLKNTRELLMEHYHGLHLEDLDQLMDKVTVFRTHFATLDIRQDHRVHLQVMEAILKQKGFIKESLDEIKKEELTRILLHEELSLKASGFKEDIVKDTIRNITQLKDIQRRNGEEGCNRYIISNSEDIYSVLFVYALFRWCGWGQQAIPFDIVPLFETLKGMTQAEACMETLFGIPEYRAHVAFRHNKQTIMLGFSDGTKDGGYLKANWSIFETKESLSGVCEKHGVRAIFFDGRGGPPARGGGKTHRFYAAQTNQIANEEIQLTVQGQTITSKYGNREQFLHNCEQLLTAGLSRTIAGSKNEIPDNMRELFTSLANLSYEKYRALKEHSLFIPYLEHKSPLSYIARANIGSRPGKRGHKKTLELTDLRAISYVGAWSQLKQNVSGYYGIGSALQSLEQQGELDRLKKAFAEIPLFKALILNSMMSLSKSNFNLTSYLKEDKQFSAFWEMLLAEYELTKKMVLLISGYDELMEEEPVSRRSIEMREKIVLPLLIIQQYALQKVSEETDFKKAYEKIITRSLYGNINASRNSV